MTSIESNSPDPRRLTVRIAQRVGHRKIAMWCWYAVGNLVGSGVIGLFAGHNRAALFACVGLTLALGWVIMKLEALHDHRLCEDCIDEVPLDPEAAVVKADRQLRAAHWTVDHRSWFRALILSAVAFAAMEFAFLPHSPAAFGFLGADCLLMTGFVLLLRAFNTHRRLLPWCPYCRRRGGGGGLHMPSPEPVDSTGRRR